MKICMVTDFYPPVIGGRERGVATLSEELARRGHDVHVITQEQPGSPDVEWVGGVRIHRMQGWGTALRRYHEDPNKPFAFTFPDLRLRNAIRAWLDQERPDIVHTHSWVMYSALSAARARPARLVHTAHEYGLMCARNTLMTSHGPCPGRGPLACVGCSKEFYGLPKAVLISGGLTISRRMHRRLDALCVISSAVADACRADDSLDSVPMYLTPECVPEALATPAEAPRPPWLPDGPFALFVGALGPHKGLTAILEARRRLDYALPLVVVGMPRHDTPDMSGEPDLTVRYDAPHPEVMAAWRAATFGLAPSVWAEPLGLVAVEAQLSGCALIASNTGGLRDVVQDGHNGLLVPPGDVPALTDAMHQLWSDSSLRTRLAAQGAQTALAFTAPRVVDHLLNVYQDQAAPIRG